MIWIFWASGNVLTSSTVMTPPYPTRFRQAIPFSIERKGQRPGPAAADG